MTDPLRSYFSSLLVNVHINDDQPLLLPPILVSDNARMSSTPKSRGDNDDEDDEETLMMEFGNSSFSSVGSTDTASTENSMGSSSSRWESVPSSSTNPKVTKYDRAIRKPVRSDT